MNPIKKLSIAVLVCLMTFAFSSDAFAARERHNHRERNGAVGAPLDGGLLAILGAAGVTYYLARKRKKDSAEA